LLCRIVLSSHSEYFRSKTSGRWGTSDGQQALEETVEADELEAAQAAVRVMYEETVPEGTSVLQLAQVCADWLTEVQVCLC
jgi:hypothetical protein